ncbi:M15 family metallopeptidase [Sporosarcina gallistercoris]|uniref:M15 family metallopeptidase n=1 Tax=Sporosarcina gallistercoris TaxID=2762245 RepID=A0ABR8PGT7_9BACL|nr:M15 family metallopeptidase [Sporosarcina gallistercoris]MBD7907379.1 M15 family metallopeptidase [Sporosarcina gallistercoris]
MKRRQDRRRTGKKQSKVLKAMLLIVVAAIAGLVIWIGANGWDVKKTLEQAGLSNSDNELPEPPLGAEDTKSEPSIEDGEADEQNPPVAEVKPEEPSEDDQPFDGGYVEGQQLPKEPTYVKNILIANKKYPLPETFAPGESKEARAAFEEMAAEAKLSSFNLTAFSTYRSYDYQVTLYNRYADRDGAEAADRYSARPGYSEHQTGLAFDIGEVNHEKHWASSSFGSTEAGKWLLANAHRYGFILRYPNHKEQITGYMHEAWHYRYVGKPIAEEIFKKNITLEEYLGVD